MDVYIAQREPELASVSEQVDEVEARLRPIIDAYEEQARLLAELNAQRPDDEHD